jgi:uncharacterized protein DUF6448
MRTATAMIIALTIAPSLWAHCDTLNGPVVAAAKQALAKGDVTPVLKWVQPKDDRQIRDAFAQAMNVRAHGGEAQALADQWFFETLVRVHRAGEGEPFTGLKETAPDAGIELADAAVESGTLDPVEKMIVGGLRQRFQEVKETQAHANDSVEAGRRYVHAYTEFIHFVEQTGADAH